MSIIWNKVFSTKQAVFDFAYSWLKALEINPNVNYLMPKIPGSQTSGNTSGITIGMGFDLKAGKDTVRIAVLKAMGLQTDLLKITDPALLSASQKIEVAYIRDLLEAVKGNSIDAVNTIMSKRANDTALKNAMVAEGLTYEPA